MSNTDVKILSKRSWDHLKELNITDKNGNVYNLKYNGLNEIEKNGKKFFDALIYFKARKNYRWFLHNYTDMQSSFKQMFVLYNIKTKKTQTVTWLTACSKAIKKYMSIS